MARFLGVAPTRVRTRRAVARSGAPECVFSVRSLVVSVAVDGAPQAYAVMERGAEEQAQIFGAKRLTPAPQLILGEGAGAYWFPAEHLVMTTEGVNLITATVLRWPGVAHRRWKRLCAAAARPYLGRVAHKLLRGPAP